MEVLLLLVKLIFEIPRSGIHRARILLVRASHARVYPTGPANRNVSPLDLR